MHLRITRLGIRLWIECVPSALNSFDAQSSGDSCHLIQLQDFRVPFTFARQLVAITFPFPFTFHTLKKKKSSTAFALGPGGLLDAVPWRGGGCSLRYPPTQAGHSRLNQMAPSGASRATRPSSLELCVFPRARIYSQVVLQFRRAQAQVGYTGTYRPRQKVHAPLHRT